jgi:hypothetical protein
MSNPENAENTYGKNTYYCDFRAENGALILEREPVRFISQPTEMVTINGMGFKKTLEQGCEVVYVRVSTANLSLVQLKHEQ